MAVTQEQINKGRELNEQYKAGEITADEAREQMSNELYKRDPAKLENADVNISQYGDDSSELNYNNPDLWGGENQKYTGENTKNTFTAYDENATVEGLDPNYQYGKNAQMANSENANYIANRNDQIASALYNAGQTSIEDVANFLRTQQGFANSTENERQNTIYSIWKRIGQIGQENPANTEQPNKNDEAVANLENDLAPEQGKVYGKPQADENNPVEGINTLVDPYSVDRVMAQARTTNLKNLQSMDSQSIAASIIAGTTPYGEQAMRDLMQYNPTKYQEIQTAIKQLKGQQTINSISSGEGETTTVINTTEGDLTEFAENNANETTSVGQILQDVKSTLESNKSATTAEEQMATIENDISRLQKRIKNLKKEASQVFKGDVPQYIVDAYVSNRTQEINDELEILENRYNAAYNRYKTELANAQWEKEYQLKQQELALKVQSENFDRIYKNWQMNMGSIEKDSDGNYYKVNINSDGTVYFSKIENMQTYTASGMKGKGLKNNNPGNIKDTQFGNVLGTSEEGFAMFLTPEDGFDALVEKVKYNQTNPNSKYYGKTIAEYFQIYAPASDGNNPEAYAQSVANALGVSVNTPISQLDATKFAAQIAKHDSGYDYSTYGQFRNNTQTQGGGGTIIADEDGTGTAAYKIISSDGVTPIDFRQRIYNLVPATLKNSDTELKNLYEIAKQLYQGGYTADEAAMVFYGLDPRNDTTGLLKPLLMKARVAGKLPETFYGNLGAFLESGDTAQAVRLVENTVLGEEERTDEANARAFISKINALEAYMNQFEAENGGVYEGTLKKFTDKYLVNGKNSKYAQLAADIQNTFGQVRTDMYGTNISGGEGQTAKDRIPNTTDQWSIIKTKLTSAKNSKLREINAVRNQYGLPQISAAQLLNPSQRVSLYSQSDWE